MSKRLEVIAKISAALNARTGGQKPCAMCGQTKWNVIDKFVAMPVIDHPQPMALVVGGATMPLVPVVCTNCGNTHLINVRVLGFTDMSELNMDDDVNSKP